MIVRRTDRTEIMAKLRAKLASGRPLSIASAGSGLVAQLLEKAGVDCVNTFSGARLRANGMGTMAMLWPILDSNAQTLEYTEQDILPALEGKAFVCACLNANDPLRDMTTVLQHLKSIGVHSVANISPSISYVDKGSTVRAVLEKSGILFRHEIEMLALARRMDMVTVGLAFDLEDAVELVKGAQPDVFCFHAGTTKGGLKGYDSGETIAETARRTEEANRAVRALKPDILLVAHGAAMETPEDAQYILRHTSCHGIWTGSSTERIPIEKAVFEAASRFTSLSLGDRPDAGR